MKKQELTYWVTLALMPKIWNKRKNEIFVKCFQNNPQISIIELFEESKNWDIVGLDDSEKELFQQAKNQLANNSFLVEELLSQGFDILPIYHQDYPKTLKLNLKYNAPTVIYLKGNKSLLQKQSVAIVGSRKADMKSLLFTDNIAKKATMEQKVVVSGFAKGVDRKALDSALEANGESIIVLPQGIMTFSSGFKEYYKSIAQGKVLVMSTFAPKAPWSVELAMARNPIIYGMASEIYVAQSDDKGGTWSGVIDGLRKNRTINVRYPDKDEKNANILLIQKGATAVDFNGNIIELSQDELKSQEQLTKEKLDSDIVRLLQTVDIISVQEIIKRLNTDINENQIRKHLDTMLQVEKKKVKNRIFYSYKGRINNDLFSYV